MLFVEFKFTGYIVFWYCRLVNTVKEMVVQKQHYIQRYSVTFVCIQNARLKKLSNYLAKFAPLVGYRFNYFLNLGAFLQE